MYIEGTHVTIINFVKKSNTWQNDLKLKTKEIDYQKKLKTSNLSIVLSLDNLRTFYIIWNKSDNLQGPTSLTNKPFLKTPTW